MITVRQTTGGDPLSFAVTVTEGDSETHHDVTMSRADCARLCGGPETAEHCVEAVFRFLLGREPKEAILARFDVSVVARYFPEFEAELAAYLGARD